MKNNSRERKAQRRERARVGLIRQLALYNDVEMTAYSTAEEQQICQDKIKRAERCLSNLGDK